jgi:Mrp family chromosome partitioning ATPase
MAEVENTKPAGGRAIAFALQKGHLGKATIPTNLLSAELRRGRRILLVDPYLQLRSKSHVRGVRI